VKGKQHCVPPSRKSERTRCARLPTLFRGLCSHHVSCQKRLLHTRRDSTGANCKQKIYQHKATSFSSHINIFSMQPSISRITYLARPSVSLSV